MQVENVYFYMAAGSTATSGKSYMVQGSNDRGATWVNLFTTNVLLNSTNNDAINIAPAGLSTDKYNMFKWLFNVNATTTSFYVVDLIGKFYYSSASIPNKLLYYNFEQNPPVDQFGGYVSVVSNSAITSSASKYGSYSATSNATSSSNVLINTVNSTISVGTNTGISFAFWLYLNGSTSGGDTKIFEAGGDNKYFIRIPAGTTTLWWCDRGSGISVSSGQWIHLVCTIDSSNYGQLYVNGSLQTSFTDSGRWAATIGRVYIGRSTTGVHYSLNGFIDDFKGYSKVLSSTEITSIYQNTDL